MEQGDGTGWGNTSAHRIVVLLSIAGIPSPTASHPANKTALKISRLRTNPLISSHEHYSAYRPSHPPPFQLLGSVQRFLHSRKSHSRSAFIRGLLFNSMRTYKAPLFQPSPTARSASRWLPSVSYSPIVPSARLTKPPNGPLPPLAAAAPAHLALPRTSNSLGQFRRRLPHLHHHRRDLPLQRLDFPPSSTGLRAYLLG